LHDLGVSSFEEYLEYIEDTANREAESRHLINAITTNTTEFFREAAHFAYLETLLPRLAADGERVGRKSLRVWCSACSTGEEAYSIAMVIEDFLRSHRDWDIRVLASDIDTNVLRTASAGVYLRERIRTVPSKYRARYFEHRPQISPAHVAVASPLRSIVVFRRINLLQDPFRFVMPVDIIFCRNVVIYFDEAGKQRLVSKFYDVLQKGGFIFIGHSESLLIQREQFQFIESTIYRKTE
jgi:chemotaxis protein methyltransferase CheR